MPSTRTPAELHAIAMATLPADDRAARGTYRPGVALVIGLLVVAIIALVGHANSCEPRRVTDYAEAVELYAEGWTAATGETMIPGGCDRVNR